MSETPLATADARVPVSSYVDVLRSLDEDGARATLERRVAWPGTPPS